MALIPHKLTLTVSEPTMCLGHTGKLDVVFPRAGSSMSRADVLSMLDKLQSCNKNHVYLTNEDKYSHTKVLKVLCNSKKAKRYSMN